MNRNYKVIWNRSLGCFTAVAEYAKGRGKSSSSAVTSGTSPLETGGTQAFTLNILRSGMVTAGLTSLVFIVSPQALAETGTNGGTGTGTAISNDCIPATTGTGAGTSGVVANSGPSTNNIAIGCSSATNNGGATIADRGNPYYTSLTANSNTVPAADRNTFTPLNASTGSVAIGTGSTTASILSLAVGQYAKTESVAGIAIGTAALSKGNTALALGRQSVASGDFSQALGNVSAAIGVGSLAIGHSATATGYRSIAIGAPDITGAGSVGGQPGAAYQTVGQTKSSAQDSIALGGGAQATANNALSLGAFSAATAEKSVAIGTNAQATATNAVVIGDGANTAVTGGVAIGLNAQVTGDDSAALGQGSVATAQSGSSYLTDVAQNNQGTLSVGRTATGNGTDINTPGSTANRSAITRRITNLADGSAASDAVTVAQLTQRSTLTDKQGTDTAAALGGNSQYSSATGAITAPTYSVVSNPANAASNVTGVGGAISALNSAVQTPLTFTGNTGTTTRKLGEALAITGSGNLSTVSSATGVAISLSNTPTFTSVTTGNSLLNNTGLTITGGPSITTNGINAANNNITNVANGSIAANSKDAINGGQVSTLVNTVTGQLNTTNANVTDNTNRSTGNMTALGGSYDAANNVYTPPSYSVFTNPSETGPTGTGNGTGDTVNTVGGAITAINSALQTPLTFAGDTGTNVTRQLGQTLAVKGGITTATDLTDNNIGVVANDTDSSLTIKLAKSLTGLTSVTTGNTTLNNSGVTILSSTGGDTVILNSSGLNNGNNKITAVANGDISTNSKDAVNGGQINTLVNTATTAINNNATNITDNTNRSIGNMTALGGSYDAATDTYTPPEYILDNSTTTVNTVGEALGNLDGRITTNTGDIADLTNTVAQQRVKYVSVNSTGGTNENNDGAIGLDAIAIGKNAQSDLEGATAVGRDANAAGFSTVAVGDNSTANQVGDVAIGVNSIATGGGADNIGAVALGADSRALGNGNIAIGDNSSSTSGNRATALGSNATTTGSRTTALGYNSVATGTAATALGDAARAEGQFTVAIRGQALADSAIAIGGQALAENAIALGGRVTASAANSVSIGRGSVANGNTLSTAAYQPLDANGNAISVTLPTAAAEVNIGSRRLTGLAAGATDTDAVNVSQLKAVNTNVTTNTTNLNNLTTGVTGIVRQDAGTGAITVGGQTGGTSVSFANSNDDARNITGVADGDISVGSTDAVNGGQINTLVNTATTAINNNTTNITDNTNRSIGNMTALGGSYDAATDTYTPPEYILDNSTTTVNTVGEALGNLDGRITTNTGDIADLNTRVDGIDFPIRSSNAQPFTTTATGIDTLAVGSNATARGIRLTAVGEGANASGINATAIGQNAKADGIAVTAIGQDATTDGINATAIGQNAKANSINTTAIGQGASANSINATAIGVGASSGFSGLAGGQGANASMSSVALGAQSAASAMGSVAIGNNSSATVNSGIALGQDSVASIEGGAIGFVPTAALTADQDAITATDSTNLGAVSVGTGTAGGNRQIVNVAAGTNDSDAVNVSQLKSVANIANQGFNITADNSDLANNETEDNVQLGETIDFTNTDNNLVATVSDNGINYDLAENIDLGVNGSVTTGNTVTNNTGVTITDSTNTAIKTTITTAGTNVTDGNGNTGNYGAATTVLTDDSGNTNASAAFGNAIFDDSGNANLSGAIGNAIFDDSGNVNLSGAQGNIILDDSDNVTTTSATGTNVTDGTNTSDYGADGFTATNGVTSTVFNQAGVSFLDDQGAPIGPSITATGIDADDTVITSVSSGLEGGTLAAATGDTLTNAANIGDLQNATTDLTELGLNFVGDDGTVIDRDLGQTLSVTGNATGNLTDGNIGVVADGTEGLSIQLAENIDLGVNGSVTTGNTVTNDTGVRIDDGNGNVTAVTLTGTNITDGTNIADYGLTGASLTDGTNTNDSTALGNTITSGTDVTTITGTGTSVTDGNGNTGNYGAATTVLTDDSGNTNASAAFGNAIFDDSGNANLSGAIGNAIFDDSGNVNLSGAQGNIILDDSDNVTTTSATGTNVTDGTNTSDYGADGLVAADGAGNSTIVNQTGLSFTNTNGTTTPSITAAGIDAGMTQITGVESAGDITNIANANNATNAGDVNAAITGVTNLGLTFAGDSGNDVQRNLGQTLNITGGATGNLTTGNIGVVANGADGLSVQLAEAIDLGTTGSVRVGNTNVNNAGITILNGPVDTVILGRAGLNNGGNRITNVADGVVSNDAATFGQVEAVDAKVDTLGSNTATNLGGGALYDDTTGSISAPTYTLDTGANTGTTADFNDVGSALSNLDGRTTTNTGAIADIQTQANQGFNVSAAGGTADNVQLGQTVDFTNTDGNLVVTNDVDNGINYNLAENIDLGVNGSITTGNTVTNNAGVKVDDGEGNATTITTGGTNVVDAAGNSADYTAIGSTLDDGNGNTNVSTATGNTLDDGNGNVTITSATGTNVTDGANTSNYGANGFTATDATGNNGISINQGGISFINGAGAPTGPSVTAAGFNAGGTVITNVGDGVAATDAANKGQVDAVSDGLADLTAGAVQYDKNQDNTVNKGSITLGGTGGTTITNVKAGNVSAGSTDAINGSQLHNLGSDVASIIGGNATLDADGNLTASNIGGTGKGNLNDAIAAVNQGNAQANENIQANTDRLDAGLSFSADNGDNISKSIGDGVIQLEGGDNITTTTTASGIKFDLSGNINVDSVTADSVTTGNTTLNSNGVTITNGPSMTSAGINAGGKTITGVADGIEATDAVNFGQLSALDSKLSNSVNELGYKINEVEDDANAGISAAMAMSSLPQAYIPGKSMIGGGVATYNGESAVAVGVSKVSDNGRWVFKVNGTADTQGNAGGAVGAGFHF
ncbi:YadA-like family protein [Psychrobacter piscatorii]|uniref:YadA-like family protein n=1 Tax=Psychrobacter piscatorii TaxID=554343 RepID=UPI001917ACEE|nr:YadA-like family protein [Psychrobacter piscatorii]